jgi:ABC-2 type transport system ATP-binding protein
VEIAGRGFTQEALAMLRTRPEVTAMESRNGHLILDVRSEMATAPLISLLVNAGAQVEEVRRGKASLEEVFLTLMEEER